MSDEMDDFFYSVECGESFPCNIAGHVCTKMILPLHEHGRCQQQFTEVCLMISSNDTSVHFVVLFSLGIAVII